MLGWKQNNRHARSHLHHMLLGAESNLISKGPHWSRGPLKRSSFTQQHSFISPLSMSFFLKHCMKVMKYSGLRGKTGAFPSSWVGRQLLTTGPNKKPFKTFQRHLWLCVVCLICWLKYLKGKEKGEVQKDCWKGCKRKKLEENEGPECFLFILHRAFFKKAKSASLGKNTYTIEAHIW